MFEVGFGMFSSLLWFLKPTCFRQALNSLDPDLTINQVTVDQKSSGAISHRSLRAGPVTTQTAGRAAALGPSLRRVGERRTSSGCLKLICGMEGLLTVSLKVGRVAGSRKSRIPSPFPIPPDEAMVLEHQLGTRWALPMETACWGFNWYIIGGGGGREPKISP